PTARTRRPRPVLRRSLPPASPEQEARARRLPAAERLLRTECPLGVERLPGVELLAAGAPVVAVPVAAVPVAGASAVRAPPVAVSVPAVGPPAAGPPAVRPSRASPGRPACRHLQKHLKLTQGRPPHLRSGGCRPPRRCVAW